MKDPSLPIAILGAGLAGLSCARGLAAGGRTPDLFDKGRAAGGRLASRRVDLSENGTALRFDHGAQYLTARGPGFAAALRAAGARPWPDPDRLVGVPAMSALPRHLAEGLPPIRLRRHAAALEPGPGGRGWMVLHLDAGAVRPDRPVPPEALAAAERAGPYAAVALALPAPQAAPLVAPHAPAWAEALAAEVRIAPCWTVMAAFAARLPLPDTLRPGEGAIGWAARDSSKPGRDAAAETWVVQAGPAWSRAHLEDRADSVVPALLDALAGLAGTPLPPPAHAAAHRWRHAMVETPLGAPCLWDPALGLGLAGDWCLAARAEAAFDSGAALAAAMLGA